MEGELWYNERRGIVAPGGARYAPDRIHLTEKCIVTILPLRNEDDKRGRITAVRAGLLAWFPSHGRRFPWRELNLPHYHLAVAEVMLQRTTAAQVSAIYPAFLDRYPLPEHLLKASEGEVEEFIAPLGLRRQRARTLTGIARFLIENGGEFPPDRRALEELEGVGQYTASALLALAHGRPEPLLDVNAERVLTRVFGLERGITGKRGKTLREVASELVDCGEDSLRVSLAVLDLGALACRLGNPRCGECPLLDACLFASGTNGEQKEVQRAAA
jgi:A/G-specific adenine glycosylase